MNAVLVVNAGSSSLKFGLYEANGKEADPPLLAKGVVTAADGALVLQVEDADARALAGSRTPLHGDAFDPDRAAAPMFDWLDGHLSPGGRGGPALLAVGHRVVHGGPTFAQPVLVDDAVLQALDALVPLAPLHQPHNLSPMRRVRERWPGVPQVACFDTAFHATCQPVAQAFALPRDLTDAGVRRYGFHGLSYEHVASRLPAVLGTDAARGRIVVAHLGNGASLCAMADGRSVATTMGFSALDGLVMGTRCGTLDAGVLLYLMQDHGHHRGMDEARLTDLLYRRSGLLGVSGISGDMAMLLESADPGAEEAIALFVYRVVVEIGALAAALGGLDALVFTAGIGENAAAVRARVCAGCRWLGAVLDERANDAALELIHAPGSTLRLAVVPTDEDLTIARHTVRCIAASA